MLYQIIMNGSRPVGMPPPGRGPARNRPPILGMCLEVPYVGASHVPICILPCLLILIDQNRETTQM